MKLFRKKEVWCPTLGGCFVLFLLIAALGCGLLSGLYSFLAEHKPVPRPELLILEGWLEDDLLARVCAEAPTGTLFVTTGGPIMLGGDLFGERNYAELAATRLMKLGIPEGAIIVAPAPESRRNRTYAAALGARDELKKRGLLTKPANLFSLGAHSRRSYLLFRLAFDSKASLGIVSLESSQYDLKNWWKSSLAFKHQVNELISWIYIQLMRWRY